MRRVVFHYEVRRASPLSYGNYLDACGYSGTEGVIVETARILADAGHSVVVAGCSDAPAEGRVTYRDDLAAVDPATVDVLVPSIDAVASPARHRPVHAFLSRLRPGTQVIVYLHVHVSESALVEFVRRTARLGLGVAFVAVSGPVASHYAPLCRDLQVRLVTIPNSINAEVFSAPPPAIDRSSRIAFFASYERGGETARMVAAELGYEFRCSSYFGPDGRPSLGKRALRRQLEACDYFVYPLCLPTGQVHHDTYGCCVHEALACGAIVITWDVACLRDVFGENLILLPPPRKWGYDPRAPLGWNRKMRTSPRVVQTFADAVRWWDGHPDLKEQLRRRGRTWAVERTYADTELRRAVLDIFGR